MCLRGSQKCVSGRVGLNGLGSGQISGQVLTQSIPNFGQVWAILGQFGKVWASLGKLGQVRTSLVKANGKEEAERIRKGNKNFSG